MPAVFLGSKSLGETIPTGFVAVGAVVANLQAQLAGALEAQARLTITPPSLAGNLAIAQQLVVGIEAAIALGLPTVDFQLAGLAVLIADITAQLSVLLAFQATFGATIFMYAAEGRMDQIGQDLAQEIGTGPPGTQPTDIASAILIAAASPASRLALSAFFGVQFNV